MAKYTDPTDRPETLPHGRYLAEFYNPTPKIRGGGTPKKNLRPTKISVNFVPLQTLIANISGMRQHISKIGKRYKLAQFLLRLMKKVR